MQRKETEHQAAVAALQQQIETSRRQTEIIRSNVDNEQGVQHAAHP